MEKVRDKAAEHGLRLLLVSARKVSKTCPIHGVELSLPLGLKIGLCPRGHWVHRAVAAVLNMLRKAVERLEPEYAEAVKRALSAVDEEALEKWSAIVLSVERVFKAQRPAVLTRASPMTPPGTSSEGYRAPINRPKGTPRPSKRGGGQLAAEENWEEGD